MPEKNFLESMLDGVESTIEAFENIPDKHERDRRQPEFIDVDEPGCELCGDVKFIKDENNPGKFVGCPLCNDKVNPKKLAP